LLIELQLIPDADSRDTERLGLQLRAELLRLDVDTVRPLASAVAPEGAKGGAVDWGSLLVTLSGAGGVFASVIALARGWLTRHSAAQAIKMTIDGDTIELGQASAWEREELIAGWVRRQSGE
jgi:hypothetical protein